MRVSGFLSLLFFCDAYELFTNLRIKEFPIKLFTYKFVIPNKICETRIIVVLYWKGFFLIRDIEVLSYYPRVSWRRKVREQSDTTYITPVGRWKWNKKLSKSCTFYNRSTFFVVYFITSTLSYRLCITYSLLSYTLCLRLTPFILKQKHA